jgi:hypothetical protein
METLKKIAVAIVGIGLGWALFGVRGLIVYFLVGPPVALAIYWIARLMRGKGGELGPPIPSLNLSERAVDSDGTTR